MLFVSCRVVSCRVVSCRVVVVIRCCPALSCLFLSLRLLPCLPFPSLLFSSLLFYCVALPCPFLSCLLLSCLALPRLVLPCLALSCLVLYEEENAYTMSLLLLHFWHAGTSPQPVVLDSNLRCPLDCKVSISCLYVWCVSLYEGTRLVFLVYKSTCARLLRASFCLSSSSSRQRHVASLSFCVVSSKKVHVMPIYPLETAL